MPEWTFALIAVVWIAVGIPFQRKFGEGNAPMWHKVIFICLWPFIFFASLVIFIFKEVSGEFD